MMATYGQWAKKRELGRISWVCGSEPVLIEEIVATALAQATSSLVLDAAECSEADVWSAVASPPADPDERLLVLVRSAQRLKRWDQLAPLLTARDLGQVRVLFVSSEERLARRRGEDEEKAVLAPHLALLRDSRPGMVVECRVPEDWRDMPEWLLEWASTALGGAGRVAGEMLLMLSGSITEAAAVAAKLTGAGIPPSREMITALADPAASYTEAVIAGRTAEALAAAAGMTREDTGAAIGLLASRLDLLLALHEAAMRHWDARETAVKGSVPSFLQLRYRAAAASYSHDRARSLRLVLAEADAAWRSGAQDGVPEFVAVLWAA
jgi:hypothetical protein